MNRAGRRSRTGNHCIALTKNGTLTADDVGVHSKKIMWFQCPDCGHEWETSPFDATSSRWPCSVCLGRAAESGDAVARMVMTSHAFDPSKSFEVLYPALVAEWHSTRNTSGPSGCLPTSFRRAWWLCGSCGSEWYASIRARVRTYRIMTGAIPPDSHGLACCPLCPRPAHLIPRVPVCTRMVSEMRFAGEWDEGKNGRASSEVRATSNFVAWWRCGEGHEWQVSPRGRFKVDKGCPTCVSALYRQPTVVGDFYVYRITNLVTGKVYIGQSRDPLKRWSEHVHAASGDTGLTYIHRALRKYGPDNFGFEVLSYHGTQAEVDEAEVKQIAEHDSMNHERGYNLQPGGRGDAPTSRKSRTLNYEGAQEWCRELGVRSAKDYETERLAGLVKLPVSPAATYKGRWQGWAEFLGLYFSYEECSAHALEVGAVSEAHWDKLWREGKLDGRAPRHPRIVYRSEWRGWGPFFQESRWVILVTFTNANVPPVEVGSFKQARVVVRKAAWGSGGAKLSIKGLEVGSVTRSGILSMKLPRAMQPKVANAKHASRGRPIGS